MLATLVIAATGDAEAAVFAPQAIGPNAFLPSCVQASFDAPRRPRVGYPMHATSQVSGPIVHDVPVRVKHFFTAAYLPICRATPPHCLTCAGECARGSAWGDANTTGFCSCRIYDSL
jgi:hypothetical protein